MVVGTELCQKPCSLLESASWARRTAGPEGAQEMELRRDGVWHAGEEVGVGSLSVSQQLSRLRFPELSAVQHVVGTVHVATEH